MADHKKGHDKDHKHDHDANRDPITGEPGYNDVQPLKRPRSSMVPTMIFDAQGRPILAYGSPGGATIINSVVNVTVNVIDADDVRKARGVARELTGVRRAVIFGDRLHVTVEYVDPADSPHLTVDLVGRDRRVWCRIDGWEDHRFQTDELTWPIATEPETNAVAEPQPDPEEGGGLEERLEAQEGGIAQPEGRFRVTCAIVSVPPPGVPAVRVLRGPTVRPVAVRGLLGPRLQISPVGVHHVLVPRGTMEERIERQGAP